MSACSEKIEPIEIFFEEPVVFLKGDDTYNIRVKTNAPDTKYFAWGANRDTDESFTGSTFFHEDGYLYLRNVSIRKPFGNIRLTIFSEIPINDKLYTGKYVVEKEGSKIIEYTIVFNSTKVSGSKYSQNTKNDVYNYISNEVNELNQDNGADIRNFQSASEYFGSTAEEIQKIYHDFILERAAKRDNK
jgi:hypothetical protein